MSTIADPPLAILIPSLPNDIALQCLARVPRQHHPVLSAVSKAIKFLLTSPEFFAARSTLNRTEHRIYLTIRSLDFHAARLFTLYRRPNSDSTMSNGNFIMVPISGFPNDRIHFFEYAVLGTKIYVLGGRSTGFLSKEMWVFDCRFHTWEQGPGMPTARQHRMVALDGKIYVIGRLTVEDSWFYVFDPVARQWESLPSPKLRVYYKRVVGCGIRGGKVCVWLEREELRFDPVMKTWEVFGSGIGQGWYWRKQMCEVNGVLFCVAYVEDGEDNDNNDDHYNFVLKRFDERNDDHYNFVLKFFDERIGMWKRLQLVNDRGEFPNHLQEIRMANVGESLVIMGLEYHTEHGILSKQVWFGEIEVKKDDDGDFRGEFLFSEVIYSTLRKEPIYLCSCMPVSL